MIVVHLDFLLMELYSEPYVIALAAFGVPFGLKLEENHICFNT